MTGAARSLSRGSVIWLDLDPVKGREQGRRRPGLIVSSPGYLATIPSVVIVLPVTTRARGLPHHVELRGPNLSLDESSFAMTEQPRTVDRSRFTGSAGSVDAATMREVDLWLRDWLGLPTASD